jgi:hypothetical protein
VRTYSATLGEQGVPESFEWLWYRCTIDVPAELPSGRLHLWFAEIDGRGGEVFLDGELVGELRPKRGPQELEVTGKLRPGRTSTVAVKIDHRRISELFLGGIIQPVMLWAER